MTDTLSLQEFCDDVENNGELLRCCGCFNTLAMSGNCEIQPIEGLIIPFLPDQPVEGMVCEMCVAAGRKPAKAVVIIQEKDNPATIRVTYINVDDLVKPGPTSAPEPPTEDDAVQENPS